MSILKVFGGKINNHTQLRQKVVYVFHDKQNIIPDVILPRFVRGHGIPVDNPEMVATAMYLEHMSYAFPGSRLAYHILLDFNGEICGEKADEVAWKINGFLRDRGISFVQAVHHMKGDGTIWAPHVHIIISTMFVDGPNRGRKYHIDKTELAAYKDFANDVLEEYELPPIFVNWKG